MKVRDILNTLHHWVPVESAQPYDNTGLQIGDPESRVERALVALDLTPSVVAEAVEIGANLVVTHHPLLFKGLKIISASDFVGGMVIEMARRGIALVAAHTNLDAARNGVSARLADLLGVRRADFLEPLSSDLVKLVTYAPNEYADQIRMAITGATDQSVGPYRDVAFQSPGEGFFRPLENAKPFIGTAGGGVERVDERRIELTLSKKNLTASLAALESAHPYETVVFDVYELSLPSMDAGMGMIGSLDEETSLSEFMDRICSVLGTPTVRFVGSPESRIRSVAVCGGAGRDLIGAALRRGADAFVTADLPYHSFFEPLGPEGETRMALIDAGHYETEVECEALLVEWLSTNLPDVDWVRTGERTSPIRAHVLARSESSNS